MVLDVCFFSIVLGIWIKIDFRIDVLCIWIILVGVGFRVWGVLVLCSG